MSSDKSNLPSYKFSEKYDSEHARGYFEKHSTGFKRRVSNWRENAMARKALIMAGRPKLVLDLPCGTGRFWEMLCEEPERVIYAGDNSQDMIDVGMQVRPKEVTARVAKTFKLSAFDTQLPDNFVECIFCIRLLHHIQNSEDRVKMLKEFARVTSDTLVVSLWVDGNYRAHRLKKKMQRRAERGESAQPRDRLLLERAQVAREFTEAGFEIVGHVDFVKYWDKWRTYVLRVAKK